MIAVLDAVLAPPPPLELPDLVAWSRTVRHRVAALTAPYARAVVSGLLADRLGFAVAAGYEAALHRLLPDLPQGRVFALAATEAGGAHPRAIQTTLRPHAAGFVLSGRKEFVTLGTLAEEVLVVASTGEDAEGRNRLRVARVAIRAPGARLLPLPPTPFAPEVPHAALELDAVAVAEGAVLSGDGYDDVLKPFRTVEDVHVHAALLGYVAGVARRIEAPRSLREAIAAAVCAGSAIAEGEPRAPAIHLALAGWLTEARRIAEEIERAFGATTSEERARWERDRPILEVAGRARAARRERAWERINIY